MLCSFCDRTWQGGKKELIDPIDPRHCPICRWEQIVLRCSECIASAERIRRSYAHNPNNGKVEVIHHLLDWGIVYLLNQSGDEELIVTAARISHGRKAYQDDRDAQLLEKLIQLGHWTPFEHVHLTFYIRCPIFVWRQWIRHRTAHVNERSMRYARSTMLFEHGELSDNSAYGRAITASIDAYTQLLKSYPKEKARIVLPLSTYTEAIWTIDLRNLLHFLELRLHKDAQKEIRLYAQLILEELKQRFPTVVNAFIEHQLEAIKLSKQEARRLRELLSKLDGNEELESIKKKLAS